EPRVRRLAPLVLRPEGQATRDKGPGTRVPGRGTRDQGLTRRPGEGAAAEQMQVDVEHGLPGAGVRVEHGPVAAVRNPAFLRDGGGAPHDFADDSVIFR